MRKIICSGIFSILAFNSCGASQSPQFFSGQGAFVPQVSVSYSPMENLKKCVCNDFKKSISADVEECRKDPRSQGARFGWVVISGLATRPQLRDIGKGLSLCDSIGILQLKGIGLDDNKLYDFVENLGYRGPKTITRLDIRDNQITEEGIAIMLGELKIRGISVAEIVRDNNRTGGGVNPLMIVEAPKFPGEKFYVFNTNFDFIQKVDDLKLHIQGFGKDSSFFKQIAVRLAPAIMSGFSIDLSGNDLDDEKLHAFIDGICGKGYRYKIRVRGLDLSNNNLSSEGIIEAVRKSTKANVQIGKLIVENNPGAEGIEPKAEVVFAEETEKKAIFLEENIHNLLDPVRPDPIQKLRYYGELHSGDAKTLGKLPNLKGVEYINLSGCRLNDNRFGRFVRYFLPQCERGSVLKELVLDNNNITSGGLLSMIKRCAQLGVRIERLSINNNSLGMAGGVALFYALNSSVLNEYSCENCDISPDVWNALNEVKELVPKYTHIVEYITQMRAEFEERAAKGISELLEGIFGKEFAKAVLSANSCRNGCLNNIKEEVLRVSSARVGISDDQALKMSTDFDRFNREYMKIMTQYYEDFKQYRKSSCQEEAAAITDALREKCKMIKSELLADLLKVLGVPSDEVWRLL